MSWTGKIIGGAVANFVPWGDDIVGKVSNRKITPENKALAETVLKSGKSVAKLEAKSKANKNKKSRHVAKAILTNTKASPELKSRAKKIIEKQDKSALAEEKGVLAGKVKFVKNAAAVIGYATPIPVALITKVALTPVTYKLDENQESNSMCDRAKRVGQTAAGAITSVAMYYATPAILSMADALVMSIASSYLPSAFVGVLGAVGAGATVAVGGAVAVGVLGVAVARDAYTGNLPGSS